jgi:hypothetical protein
MSAFWTRGRDSRAESENAAAAGARVRIWQLTAADRCDRCGAQAYVRVLLPRRLELLFCAHHSRQYSSALANIAVEIQDETIRLACCALCGILAIRFANRPVARHRSAAKAMTRFTPTDTSGAASRQPPERRDGCPWRDPGPQVELQEMMRVRPSSENTELRNAHRALVLNS